MKTREISFTLIITVFSFLLLQTACNKKPEKIGLDIIDENKLGVYDTSFSVTGFSSVEDSVLTDELTRNLLGSLRTENFGLTNAGFYSHLRLSQTSPNFGDDPQPDSAILTLVYNGYYGFINTPHTVKVYEVMQDFYKDSAYYSKTLFNLEPLTELANYNFIPNPNDSILQEEDSTYITAELRIPLNDLFINKIMFPDDDSLLNSNEYFVEYFKGIFVVTDSVSSPGEGSILYFDLLNPRSNATIYYNDTLTYELSINSSCATVGKYQHNYSKSLNQNFRNQIVNNDTTLGSESLYLQGLAGIQTNIGLLSLTEWVGTNKYAINEAKLIIPANEPIEELAPPERLLLFQYDENGEINVMQDQFEGDNYFGGTYIEASNAYEFRISLYVQSVLNGSPDYGLVLYASGKSVNANQVILYGTEPENTTLPKMYLNVIYTLIE